MPEDIRWMLELTSPQVKKILAPYDKRLGITDLVLSKSQKLLEDALKGNNMLTRTELADFFERNSLKARGQKLAHILSRAELNALICSGPLRGRQFTYGLLEELVPKTKKLSMEEALSKLAWKYFNSHGPAQLIDFGWWSGLSAKDANCGLDSVKSELENATFNGKTYWFFPQDSKQASLGDTCDHDNQAFLLSVYDEYGIAYKDRSDISPKRDIERMLSMGNALTAIIVLGGKAVGTWKRVLRKGTVEIILAPFRKLNKEETAAVRKAAKRYGEYLNKEVVM
jgi:hypothetical protein